ncbi:hypothetical protein B0H11DRAFT_2270081 [Mycena galericulata]|nr:hypothetical protein B0H11DRAFT_2270081 [Mycena galericulata]
MPTDTSLSLTNRRLILSSSEDIHEHLHSVNFDEVTTFSIDGNSIGVQAGLSLRELLDRMPKIKSANFSNIFSRRQKEEIPDTLAAICAGLNKKPSLVDVDFSDNAIGAIAVESIVSLLVENRSLRVLRMNNVGFGPAAGTIVAKALELGALIQSIQNQPSNLRAIICGRSRLENGSAPSWSDAFAAHINLVAVHIPQNGIKEAGLAAIARGLESCRSLRYLNVSDNTARETALDATRADPDVDATTTFASALSSWKDLEYLNLSDCCLTASGTRQIIDALSKGNNSRLNSLLLENASFDASFGTTLKNALHSGSLPNLVTLKLAEHEGLDDMEDEINRMMTELGGVVSFDRDIEDPEDTIFLDNILAGLTDIPSPVSLVDAMKALDVSSGA